VPYGAATVLAPPVISSDVNIWPFQLRLKVRGDTEMGIDFRVTQQSHHGVRVTAGNGDRIETIPLLGSELRFRRQTSSMVPSPPQLRALEKPRFRAGLRR
jgi:hypothetical protein